MLHVATCSFIFQPPAHSGTPSFLLHRHPPGVPRPQRRLTTPHRALLSSTVEARAQGSQSGIIGNRYHHFGYERLHLLTSDEHTTALSVQLLLPSYHHLLSRSAGLFRLDSQLISSFHAHVDTSPVRPINLASRSLAKLTTLPPLSLSYILHLITKQSLRSLSCFLCPPHSLVQ